MELTAFIGILLSMNISGFSVADYLISKSLDIGTGKLWNALKKKLQDKPYSIECQLYDAIEASVERYADLNNLNEIAPACEMIYAAWIQEGTLSEKMIEAALSEINRNYISKRNIKLWYSQFFDEVEKRENLYRWFLLHTSKGISEQIEKRNQELLDKIQNMIDRPYAEVTLQNEAGKLRYDRKLREVITAPLFDEAFSIKDIYLTMHGVIEENNVMPESKVIMHVVEDCTSYLWNWYESGVNQLLFLSGEPGSGKSSLVKMVAATLSASMGKNGIVVLIDLFRLSFSDKRSALEVLEEYIQKNYPWFFEEKRNGVRLLILDGLDEIKYKVYENAMELARELEGCSWNVQWKAIISGRTQVVQLATREIRCMKLNVLPLFLDEYEQIKWKNKVEPSSILGEDLRPVYWNKLVEAFHIEQEIPVLNERFDELSKSPLLLFLVVWTIKHTGISFSELKNTAELYENIFKYVYTREYNRAEEKEIYYRTDEYKEYQQMLHFMGGCAYRENSKAISVSQIYHFCNKMKQEDLCKKWIQLHKEENPSKLVLLFFLREMQDEMDWNESTIEFIHKTFYEYLAALAVIEFLFWADEKREEKEYLPLMFYFFSENLLGNGEIVSFMKEILLNKSLVIKEKKVDLQRMGEVISNVLFWGYHVNYPFVISTQEQDGENISVASYDDLKKKISVYEDNIQQLVKMVIELRNEEEFLLNFSASKFGGVKMLWWKFDGAFLGKSYFGDSIISGSSFKDCKMQDAAFISAIADRTIFSKADLTGADFSAAYLATADFSAAILKNTSFELAELEGAYFCEVELLRTNFASADLTAANFDKAVLRETDFQSADLSRTDFSYVEIESANWDNCIMEGTKLRGVKLVQFDLDNPDIIEMLAEADLEQADWSGVMEEQKKKLGR